MKKTFIVLLFIVFAGLTYLVEESNPVNSTQEIKMDETELNSNNIVSDYYIKAQLIPVEKLLNGHQKIVWHNKTNFSTDKIYFHLYSNGYKSNKTQLAQKKLIPNECRTSIDILKLNVDGKISNFIYENEQFGDSTVAYIEIGKFLEPHDSVVIEIDFKIKVPKTLNGLGYYSGESFYFFSQWFPQIGVFRNNQWYCSKMYSEFDFYSEFSNFTTQIEVPNHLKIGASGNLVDSVKSKLTTTYFFEEKNIIDFAWFAAKEIIQSSSEFKSANGKSVLINASVQEMRDWYTERSINSVKNALTYLEEYFGPYEHKSISIVDLPSNNRKAGRAFPTLITFNTDLISPEDLQSPEREIIHQTVQQYFSSMMSTNQVVEAWLSEGICTYITNKILKRFYGNQNLSFKLATYFPVNGINFISYNEIPLVYTLGDYTYPVGTKSLKNYYRNLKTGTIADTSYLHPTELAYEVNTKSKPEIVLLTLERLIGEDKVILALQEFFSKYKFKHPKGNDFLDIIKSITSKDLTWFKENFYTNAYYFDYGVSDIQKISETEYTVLCRRYGDGKFPVDVVLYTDKDTLISQWDGKDTWTNIQFSTENEVLAAEIDPDRINLLDINFANNSYTVNPQYFITFSLSLRWLFWVQNMLMILGSAG